MVKDGQVLVKKGYGYADVAAKKTMDVDRTLMRIGSTSKLFTWTRCCNWSRRARSI